MSNSIVIDGASNCTSGANNRVGKHFATSHGQPAAVIGMNMCKQDVGYLLRADPRGSQAERQLVELGPKEMSQKRSCAGDFKSRV